MTCVWNSLIAGLRDEDLTRVLGVRKAQAQVHPHLFVEGLKKVNRPTMGVRWQGGLLTSKGTQRKQRVDRQLQCSRHSKRSSHIELRSVYASCRRGVSGIYSPQLSWPRDSIRSRAASVRSARELEPWAHERAVVVSFEIIFFSCCFCRSRHDHRRGSVQLVGMWT